MTFLDAELPPGTYEPGLGMAAGVVEGALAQARCARLARHGAAQGVRRRRAQRGRALRRGRGAAATRRAAEHHWTADRQSGPVINRFGSEELKHRFLPAISRGELTFSIGMSEPDAGSDLASVACRATKVDGGYELSGTKIWTSNAHFADYAIVLCRTSDADDRHAGLSQLIVDLHSPGVTVNPIPFLDGTEDFNEVVFDRCSCPKTCCSAARARAGRRTRRSSASSAPVPSGGSRRILVVEHFVREYGDDLGVDAVRFLGDSVARWWGIRQVSLTVRAHDRRREAAVGGVGARQRPRHAVRARGDGAHPDPGRRRAVAGVVVDVPAPARRARCSSRRRGPSAAAPTRSCAA